MLGNDPQPAHMDDFVDTADDNGGVHINSGIPNRAFHRLAMSLGGHSWEHAGRILYATLGHPRLRPAAGFRAFARVNAHVARTLYGTASREESAVVSAWADVGVEFQPVPAARRVRMRRSGGLVAVRPLETEVDLTSGEGDAGVVAEMLDALDMARLAAPPRPGPGADSFQYRADPRPRR